MSRNEIHLSTHGVISCIKASRYFSCKIISLCVIQTYCDESANDVNCLKTKAREEQSTKKYLDKFGEVFRQ